MRLAMVRNAAPACMLSPLTLITRMPLKKSSAMIPHATSSGRGRETNNLQPPSRSNSRRRPTLAPSWSSVSVFPLAPAGAAQESKIQAFESRTMLARFGLAPLSATFFRESRLVDFGTALSSLGSHSKGSGTIPCPSELSSVGPTYLDRLRDGSGAMACGDWSSGEKACASSKDFVSILGGTPSSGGDSSGSFSSERETVDRPSFGPTSTPSASCPKRAASTSSSVATP
mmetsp:Transcript_32380/g.74826  ORF Transcript_32380/g.74826 Transcript_32380/m.74826 type:complete len:229 (+) Transcript_32380:196-882(+)